MAWITHFEVRSGTGQQQPSRVVGKVKVFDLPDGEPVVQIDTFGSDQREMPGKQSQTIQLDRKAAQELFEILRDTYKL
jgi:hypothetical protein